MSRSVKIYKNNDFTCVDITVNGNTEYFASDRGRSLIVVEGGVKILPNPEEKILNNQIILISELVDNFGATTGKELRDSFLSQDFFKKGGGGGIGGKFISKLPPNLEMSENIGGWKKGTKVSDFLDMSFTTFVENQNFPTVPARVQTLPYAILTNKISLDKEVGTPVAQSFIVELNRGIIKNGDDTTAGNVVGIIDEILHNNPANNSNTFSYTKISDTKYSVDVLPYSINLGNNTWEVIVKNLAGTQTYSDNKGGTDLVNSIESQKNQLLRNPVTCNIVGKYYRFHSLGVDGSSPTDSLGIKALEKEFLSVNNTGIWEINIPANTKEFSFYIPTGKTIDGIDKGNLGAPLKSSFLADKTDLIIKDGGNNDVNYSMYRINWKGYDTPTIFKITIS